jgi:hypothetical protein
MKTITKNNYHALIGLREVAKRYLELLDQLNDAAQEITGELDSEGKKETMGHTSDYLYGSRELDSLLSILKIEVRSE